MTGNNIRASDPADANHPNNSPWGRRPTTNMIRREAKKHTRKYGKDSVRKTVYRNGCIRLTFRKDANDSRMPNGIANSVNQKH